MDNSTIAMSMGFKAMWGFSPSFDLLEHIPKRVEVDDIDPINILLCEPGDIRHVMQTIAYRRRKNYQQPLHLYIHSNHMESLARYMLQLQIFMDWELPVRQKCNLFLEVFGNSLVQERTSQYISRKANELIDLVYDEQGIMADLLNLSHLKMKQRDELVDIFKSWKHTVQFDVVKLRDQRLRNYYGNRYDFRTNIVDWDYTMILKKVENACIIHSKQYKKWRESGIAFEFGDQTYTIPNRTMSSYTEAKKRGHGPILQLGYWLDIIVSPYISLGLDCYKSNKFAEGLFEIHNKGSGVEQNRHNTVEVAVYNVLSFLFEIETGEIYKMKKAHEIYSGIGDDELEQTNESKTRFEVCEELNALDNNESSRVECTSESVDKQSLCQDINDANALEKARNIVNAFNGVKIIPLAGKISEMYSKKKYKNCFEEAFFSMHSSHILDKQKVTDERNILCLMKDQSNISIESSTFLIPLKETQRLQYLEKIVEMTKELSLKPKFKFHSENKPSTEDILDPGLSVLHFSFDRTV